MRLLLTRPEPDASRTAQVLRERGHDVLVAPVLTIQAVEPDLAGSYAAVVMTSANAARALADHPRSGEITKLRCFTVGARSAAAARAAGFTDVLSSNGAMGDLVETVAARFAGNSASLLYLAGKDRAGDLAAALGAKNIAVTTVVTYHAVAQERLPVELARALGSSRLDGALHYSSRSVATLLQLVEEGVARNELLGLAHYCLSEAVAAILRDAGATRIEIAAHPDENALIALL